MVRLVEVICHGGNDVRQGLSMKVVGLWSGKSRGINNNKQPRKAATGAWQGCYNSVIIFANNNDKLIIINYNLQI